MTESQHDRGEQAGETAGSVILLTTPRSYRVEPFLEAGRRLGIRLVQVVDMPRQLADEWHYELGIDFSDLEAAVESLVEMAHRHDARAILSVDDSGSVLAARASAVLGLPHNSPQAAEAARDKFRMRQLLHAAGVSSPWCLPFTTADSAATIASQVDFPVVVKPSSLSGSRGVIRANDQGELAAALERTGRLLHSLVADGEPQPILVEQYIPGIEVALEGMMDQGRLKVLALFDKPDPLEGPFFEETIYVTPSRLPPETQTAVADCAAQAAAALGLVTGPIHAELRLNEAGPWIVEVAGRSIGGLCSQTLHFGTGTTLEALILRQAAGLKLASTQRSGQAEGVMMIPIPEAGILRTVHGCKAAEAVPHVDRVEITARLNYPLVPLPEGESYLGFIFASGETPEDVEEALRAAHGKLRFEIQPQIPLTPVAS